MARESSFRGLILEQLQALKQRALSWRTGLLGLQVPSTSGINVHATESYKSISSTLLSPARSRNSCVKKLPAHLSHLCGHYSCRSDQDHKVLVCKDEYTKGCFKEDAIDNGAIATFRDTLRFMVRVVETGKLQYTY